MAKIRFGSEEENVVTREEFPLEKAKETLKNETVAVIGYGVQGPAQALNLKDNGIDVVVGQAPEFKDDWNKAVNDGWEPDKTLFPVGEAVKRGTIVQYLVSDAAQMMIWDQVKQNLNEGDADGLLNFASPTSPFTTVSDTIVINKNTSDIDKFISLPPRQIRSSGTGYTNLGNDPSAHNFITSENRVNVGMEMDLPLELETNGLTYRDTVGFDMDVDVDFDEAVNLYGIFKNQFPFSIDIRVVCRDSVTNRDLLTLEPLDADGQNASILDAPEVDENGRIKSPKENRIYFKVTGDEIDLLNETNQLALEAMVKTSKTSEGNYTGVKFYTDYTLDFRMGIDETGSKLNF